MTPFFRKILFYALVFLFFLIGIGVAGYAQGWRLDIPSFALKKVGAIYVQSAPRDAAIALDGKHIKPNGGFFQTGTLVNGLFPRSYTLTLSREGYRPWKRTLSVEPAKVAEAKYALLVPEAATAVATGSAKNVWLAGSEPITLVGGELHYKNQKLRGTDILDVTADGGRALARDGATGALFLHDLTYATSTNFSSLLAKLGITGKDAQFSFDPEDGTKIIALSPHALSLIDTEKKMVGGLAKTSARTITAQVVGKSFIAWAIANTGTATSTVGLYEKSTKLSRMVGGALAGETAKLAWVNSNVLAILQRDGSLYLYDTGDDAPKKLASDVRDIAFTANGDKIAALEHKSIEIFSLRDAKDYWRFNTQNAESIGELSWHADAHNLFLHYADRVALLDLDDSAQENITPVAETEKGMYDEKGNKFFFLDKNGLSVIVFPEK